MVAVCWQLDILCRSVRGQQHVTLLNRTLFCVILWLLYVGSWTFCVGVWGVSSKWPYWIELYVVWHYCCCMLAGLERHVRIAFCGCGQMLPWCWTEETARWISHQLRLLVFHIDGMVMCIALCWCWQCLLMVGGNLLPLTVTALDVTTVTWYYRQTQDVLHPAECPPGTQQTSE